MGSGRRPNFKRREEMARLRAQSLTFAEIGERFGVTGQCVITTLKLARKSFVVKCRQCEKVIHTRHWNIKHNGPVLCMGCLAKTPDPPFRERLKAARLAAGLTATDLSRLARIRQDAIFSYEQGKSHPRWAELVKLMKALGPGFVTAGFEKSRET
jgi:DNA-binding XRE family transcriptional regulator